MIAFRLILDIFIIYIKIVSQHKLKHVNYYVIMSKRALIIQLFLKIILVQ